jgi:P4 family phage/plasmid primase-like protien
MTTTDSEKGPAGVPPGPVPPQDVLNGPDRETLARAGISSTVLDLVRATSVPDGVRFRLPDLTSSAPFEQLMYSAARRAEMAEALRAKGSNERVAKYKQPANRNGALWCPIPRADAPTVLIVEGTKGHLAAASWAGEGIEVIGINGCWGWSAGNSTPHPAMARVADRSVVVAFDADVRTNPDVNMAAERLRAHLTNHGANAVRFATLGSGTQSMDDILGELPELERTPWVDKIVTDAGDLRVMPAAERTRINAQREAEHGAAELADATRRTGLAPIPAIDKDVAAAFAYTNAATLRYDAVSGRWVTWNGVQWDRMSGDALAQAQFQMFVDLGPPVIEEKMVSGIPISTRATKWMGDYRRIKAVLGHAQSMAPLLVTNPKVWDAQPYLMTFPNGTMDLRSLEFRPSHPVDMITQVAGTVFDIGARAPEWDKFIAWAVPDKDVRRFLQRIIGYSLLGVVRHHILPCLVGATGRNGKGTFLRIMSALFGDHAGQANARLIVEGREPHDTDAGTVYGKRLAVFEETANGARWDVNSLKSLTGGDSGKVRQLYGEPYTVRPQHTLILGTNHRPNIPAGENAFWTRYREIPFTSVVEPGTAWPVDVHVIEHELPGVLNWALAGLADYWTLAKAGSDPMAAPEAVTVASADARTEGSEFSSWLAQTYVFTGSDQDTLRVQDVWERWDVHRRTVGLTNISPRAPRLIAELVVGEGQGKVTRRFDIRHAAWLDGIRQAAGAPAGPGEQGDRGKQGQTMRQTELASVSKTPGHTYQPEATEATEAKSGPFTSRDVTEEEGEERPLYKEVGQICLFASFASAGDDVSPAHTPSEAKPEANQFASEVGFASVEALSAVATGGPVALDLEGGDIKDRWRTDPAGYPRLVGLGSPGGYADTPDIPAAIEAVRRAPLLIGHNLLRFDLPVLNRAARALGIPEVDTLALATQGRLLDTMAADQLINPPPAHMKPERAMPLYSLEASAERWGTPGKTDQLPALAAEFGGYDKIPLDDVRYREYLAGDVAAHDALGRAIAPRLTPYALREMRVVAIAGMMTDAGIEVDQELNNQRVKETSTTKSTYIRILKERYGIEALRKDGKPSTAPQSTTDGRMAIVQAFGQMGVDASEIPRTGEGLPAVGKEAMRDLALRYPHRPEVQQLCSVVAGLSGVRTVYGTAQKHTHADGRVHPEILTLQASGRWSVIKPGMTVFGKRGGRVVEREIFRAGEGTLFLAADLSQIDMRAVAGHAQDPYFIDMFRDGRDAHAETALAVFGSRDRREDAKPCNHGWQYGLGVDGAVRQGIDPDLFTQFDEGMKRAFMGLCAWREGTREHVRAGGLLDNGFGRIMRPDPHRAHTQGPALMGQGTARDLMMDVILRLPSEIVKMLRIQVHDEIILEVPEKDVADVSQIVKETMTFEWCPPHGQIPVPIVGDVSKPGKNWAECYRK